MKEFYLKIKYKVGKEFYPVNHCVEFVRDAGKWYFVKSKTALQTFQIPPSLLSETFIEVIKVRNKK